VTANGLPVKQPFNRFSASVVKFAIFRHKFKCELFVVRRRVFVSVAGQRAPVLIGDPNARRLVLFAVAFSILFAATSIPAIWWGGMPASVLVASVVLGIGLAALSAADVHALRLPDKLTLPLAAVGLLMAWLMGWAPLWWRSLSAGAAFLLLCAVELAYQRLRGRSGLGRGDAKLFAASGAWLGAEGLATVLLWACGTALMTILVAACFGHRLTRTTILPFGPFLAMGTWLVWFYGPLN
jgi:prepilin signal peptidase PulO-like enzyme (type II secretory pathway)